ncbi:Flagellar hook protein FlgE [Buchnera aphidicola (Thelaxes suberi)]|uniref:flagellar hook-basal body complex protein n=1 Tax=Buchnera aphidicola TaxID=9 RepID=UPI003464E5E4
MSYLSNASGINAAMSSIDTIGKNLSNIDIPGFKSEVLPFYDLVPNDYEHNSSVGMGSMTGEKTYNFDTGPHFKTNRALDSAIVSNGFFRLKDANNKLFYSKNGHFLLDKKQNLVNSNGLYVTGYDLTTPVLNFKKTNPINLSKMIKLPGEPTNVIAVKTQINASDPIKFTDKFDPFDSTTFNRMLPMSAYDENGEKYDFNLYLIKKTPTIWKIHSVLKNHRVYNKEFIVQFNPKDGKIISKPYDTILFNKFGSPKTQQIVVDLRQLICESFDDDAVNFPVSFKINGKPSTIIKKLSLDQYGILYGIYSDGSRKMLNQLALSDFTKTSTLVESEPGLWINAETANDINPEIIGPPGLGIFGTITPGEIEGSNVNPEREIINMIMAQKNFFASKKALDIQDKINQTLINLK